MCRRSSSFLCIQIVPHGHSFRCGSPSIGWSILLAFPPEADFDDSWQHFMDRHTADMDQAAKDSFKMEDMFMCEHREILTGLPDGENPTLYTIIVATEQRAQRRGLAAALFQQINRIADENRWLSSLEATSESNARYYERFGFTTHHAAVLPGGAENDKMYFMLRPAQPLSSA